MIRRTTCGDGDTPGCGQPIILALVVPPIPVKGVPRPWVPLDPSYDPTCGMAPTHALEAGRTRCRRLEPGEVSCAPGEHLALIHFATCTARRGTPEPDWRDAG